MPTLLRLTSRVLVHGPRAEEAESVLPWREREKRREGGEREREEREEKREKVWWRLKKKGRGKRTMERNGGMRITRRKWMVGRNGMWKKVGRGYRKMGRGARFDTRVLAPHFYPVLVGRRSFSRGVDDPRRQFSSYPGEYAEARKGSRVYPLFPWLASYGYTFIRRWLYSIWLTRSRNTGGKCY